MTQEKYLDCYGRQIFEHDLVRVNTITIHDEVYKVYKNQEGYLFFVMNKRERFLSEFVSLELTLFYKN